MTDINDPPAIVSVIVPTFNRARYLPDALDSVLQQGIDGMETIVVDDGSTDDTEIAVAGYGSAVTYVRQTHQGAAAARNTGVARATGRFISFLDSDDVWMPGKTQIELALFEQNPGIDAMISDSERWRENTLVCSSWLEDRGLVVSGESPVPLHPTSHLKAGKVFATCSLTIRRAALDRLGHPPFDTSLETHEDMDFAVRMYRCCSILVLPQTLARVRRFDDGSRAGRPVPGTEYPAAVKRAMARRKYRIYEKALRQPGWSSDALLDIQAARREAAREFADNVSGWSRRGLASLVVAELRHAAFGSAATVAMRGLLPERGRSLLGQIAAARVRRRMEAGSARAREGSLP
jgi:glycosyltransferase involved in cell wall biosynthesis